ncbi:MAG TPA: hypothetical protein VFU40_10385, partial [Gemmatimonadales bacterium]|nr:hypothetical protein [Gemmatimonadales bacterium]
MRRSSCTVVYALLLGLSACDGSTAPPPVLELPPRSRLLAQASGKDESQVTVDCHLDLLIELTGELRRDEGL